MEPAFTLPGRQYTISGAYGCQSYQRRGTTGHPSDAACAYYESRSESPNGFGGAVACVVSSRRKIYKRLSGKIYILDPYGPSIRTVNMTPPKIADNMDQLMLLMQMMQSGEVTATTIPDIITKLSPEGEGF